MINKIKKQIVIILIVLSIGVTVLGFAGVVSSISRVTYKAEIEPGPLVTHAQDVWINALEWCESRGKESAVNPNDKDNTPSYYSFQFKPGTFRYYGELYGVINKGFTDEEIMELIKDQKLQRKIVEYMVNDKSVVWEQQFPDCVKRKIGKPPVY